MLLPRSAAIRRHLSTPPRPVFKSLPAENNLNQETASYSAKDYEQQAKETFVLAFKRVQQGDCTVQHLMNLALHARKIAEKLEKFPEHEGISESRFNAHQWADRIEGLMGK
jgi:hypothetical protein